MTQRVGSRNWMALEVFETRTYNVKVDVYSWSMVLYEMIMHKIPFQEMGTVGIMKTLKMGKYLCDDTFIVI